MSRHRTAQRTRSKTIAFVAAGAFSVAAASLATAATWPSGSTGAGGTARGSAYAAIGVSQPELTDRLAVPEIRPQAQTDSQISFSLAQRADQIRDVSAQRAATQLTAKMAARVAKRTATAQSQAAPAAGPRQPAATAEPATTGSPQQIAEAMLGSFGWSSGQFACLDPLWAHESGWSVTAYNPGTGAYGIPQAMPGGKMATAGPDWQTDAATQIRWGLDYIRATYGSPCGAWAHEEATGWY